jgi:hypothetical protein
VVENFELVGLVELVFEFMDGAFVNGDGRATLETGEVVFVLLDHAVERFAVG